MKLIESIELAKLDSKTRLSDALIDKFTAIPTRKGIKKAIQKGRVKINGEIGKTGDYVVGGETIELFQRSGKKDQEGISLKLEVVFEDDFMAVINKPAGIVVGGNQKRSIRNALINSLKKSKRADALRRPEPVHRLDYATSGLLLVAKTHNAMVKLNQMLEQREITKTYAAVTYGTMVNKGEIKTEIKGKPCTTLFKKIKEIPSNKYDNLSYIELIAVTGRRHQLRIHLESIGHPIIGDQKYPGEYKKTKIKGLHLHAVRLSLAHPIEENKLEFEASLPKKFDKWLKS